MGKGRWWGFPPTSCNGHACLSGLAGILLSHLANLGCLSFVVHLPLCYHTRHTCRHVSCSCLLYGSMPGEGSCLIVCYGYQCFSGRSPSTQPSLFPVQTLHIGLRSQNIWVVKFIRAYTAACHVQSPATNVLPIIRHVFTHYCCRFHNMF